MKVKQYVKYKDACLYQKDIKSLESGQWLTSEAIYFGLQVVEDQLTNNVSESVKFKQKVKLVDPSLSTLIIFENDWDDLVPLEETNKFSDYQYILMPLSDQSDLESCNSTHWFTLVYLQEKDTFLYFDPKQGQMNQKAYILAQKIKSLCLMDDTNLFKQETNINIAKVPYQTNTYDCGMYAIAFCEEIANQICINNISPENLDYTKVTDQLVTQKRQFLLTKINELAI